MKLIKISDKTKKEMLANFKKLLADYDGDGAISITPLVTSSEKTTVYITTKAWFKINALIKAYDKELAWHGIAERYNEGYLIRDIMVYPQIAASATVESDDDAYAEWCMNLPDEVINNLRFQGHSHVNMAVSPSGTDTQNWQEFLNMLGPEDFYIFCIGNKSTKFYWRIFDNQKNIMYENADITYTVVDNVTLEVMTDWATATIKDNIHEYKPITKEINYDSYYNDYYKDRTIGSDMLSRQDTVQDVYIDDEIACSHYPSLGIIVCEDTIPTEHLQELGFTYSYYYDNMTLNAAIARRELGKRIKWGTVYNRKKKIRTSKGGRKK